MTEHERSYVFTHESGSNFFNKHLSNISGKRQSRYIEDYYLNPDLRVRYLHSIDQKNIWYYLTSKDGNKANGHREESECQIDKQTSDILKKESFLCVKKTREIISDVYVDGQTLTIMYDRVYKPMKVDIIEIESDKKVSKNITEILFKTDLLECPLSAWKFFKRKIGICGTSSCGKSETSKYLSNRLNIDFGCNSLNVVEFATTFIQKYKRNPNFFDQILVLFGQQQREDMSSTADIVLSDCPTFLSYIYSLHLCNEFNEQTVLFLSKIYKKVLFDLLSYDNLIFLKLINYTDNNVRYQTHDEAIEIEDRIKNFLDDHKIPHIESNYSQANSMISKLLFLN